MTARHRLLATALSLFLAVPGCHLTTATRAGVAFVAVVPSIEAGIDEWVRWRLREEAQIGPDAVAACKHHELPAEYTACTDGVVKPRRQRLDDVRLAVGAYGAAVSAAADGVQNDLPGAAVKVIAALGAVGIRVTQAVQTGVK